MVTHAAKQETVRVKRPAAPSGDPILAAKIGSPPGAAGRLARDVSCLTAWVTIKTSPFFPCSVLSRQRQNSGIRIGRPALDFDHRVRRRGQSPAI